MKTNNYQLDLMVPNQTNKDVLFNESILKIDSFLNTSINGYLTTTPTKLSLNERYIIKGEQQQYLDHICYSSHSSKGVQYLAPQEGMILFCLSDNSFILYSNSKWNLISTSNIINPNINSSDNSLSSQTIEEEAKFHGIQGEYQIPTGKCFHYLYLNGNTNLDLIQSVNTEITIIIKQNYQRSFNILWPHNILWPQKVPHKMSTQPNGTDLIKLYRLVETEHFIGHIVAQNYQF